MFNFSAWLSQKKICNYLQNKEKFCGKNNSQLFKKAIKEIDEAIEEEVRATEIIADQKIDLKNVPIAELLATYTEHKTVLQAVFEQRRHDIDRFISGNGYDYLTVLSRTLTSAQQQAMYSKICGNFMGDMKKYIQNPKVC